MKKVLVLVLALIMLVSATACGKKADSDKKYVQDKGTLVVGITDFAPMDYTDDNGEWIGFDADLAKAFAESLGVKAEFVEIDWGKKIMEIDGKTIDCVWNGMTLVDEVTSAMNCTNAYCDNAQIVVINKDLADQITDVDALKAMDLNFGVETGSAGLEMAEENGFAYTELDSQAKALMEVAAGTVDAAIIDSLMAAAMVGEGTDYADLVPTIALNSEQYGIGFRKGSDLTDACNKFLKDSYADGTMMAIAEKYGVQLAIIEQK